MKLLVKRYGFALVALVVAFWAYALFAVPRLEPRLQLRASLGGTSPADATAGLMQSHRKRMEHLFPPGSWQLSEPKVLQTEHGTLLFKDYQPLDDGRMELKPLSIVVHTGAAGGDPANSRTVILDAPDGAILQFDSATDPARADFGRLLGGLLSGEIRIHSPATSPTANDALLVTTRNVQLDERRIWTPHAVNFRYGPSFGSGRDLVITLLPAQNNSASRAAPAVAGVKSLELVHVDKFHLETLAAGLMPGKPRPPSPQPTSSSPPPAPVEVTCLGPFLFDFVEQVASFEDEVDVLRLNPDGPSDQLNCQLLSIYFLNKKHDETTPSDVSLSRPEPDKLKLAIDRMIAVGHPVVLRAPSMGATARGERLEYHFQAQRIVLEDQDHVVLVDERFDIEARQLEYQLAPGGGIGLLWAAGPGKLRVRKTEVASLKLGGPPRMRAPIVPISARPDPTAPSMLEARWTKELRLRPFKDQHVVSLLENASVEATGMGGFTADEIHLWLNETPRAAGPRSTARPDKSPRMEIEPDRMLALGHVGIGAQQLEGATGRLEVWFRKVAPAATTTTPATAATPAAANNPPAAPPTSAAPGLGQKFYLLGELIRISILRRGEETALDQVAVEGSVRLQDAPFQGALAPSMEIVGDALELTGGMAEDAVVTVFGKPAQVRAPGMAVRGSNIHLHRGHNRLWMEGPGSMQLPLTSDLQGQPLDKPTNISVAWQQGLEFNGSVANFGGNVEVTTDHQWARADALAVTLAQKLDFANVQPGAKPEVHEIAFDGRFALESRSLDKHGQLASIDKMQSQTMKVNQQSGRLEAAGPGWVSSVRLGSAAASPLLGGAAVGAAGGARPHAAPREPAPSEPQFAYLLVEFQLQIVGNLYQRQVDFQRHVRTVYGPVADWNGTLDVDRPERLPEGGVVMNCQQLTLRQMPGSYADTTTLEMEATGDTVVEGRGFTARAARIGYTDEKQLLILEGDGRRDAELTRQTRVGGQQSHIAARKIMYWRFDNRVELDDARLLDLNQFGN
jgi:lipopolysaccharide export system protein LptA